MSKDEKFDPVYVPKGDKPKFEPPPKKAVPGGRLVQGAKAYCDAWRKYAEPIAAAMGWSIHSFGDGWVKLVSPDFKHVQQLSMASIEALEPLARSHHARTQARYLPQGSVRPGGREPDHDDPLPPKAQ